VKAIIDAKATTPVAANHFLQALRRLMKLAIESGWRKDDPAAGIRNIRNRSEGFRTWAEDDIAAYEAKFPLGSRARLAFALLLYTGQRRGDVVRMGRQYLRNGVLTIQQQKTGEEVAIPMHANLKAAIDALPKDQLTFLLTGKGKPFTPAGFTNWFHECVVEAGLPAGLSAQGLRKAVCRRLAEAGCSPHEIMAISGHSTLSEVTRYTVAANRPGLAADAMEKIEARTRTVKPAAAV
jgi:integrase